MAHKAGDIIKVGAGYSTVLADMDFETFSEAGYVWDEFKQKYRGLTPTASGIKAVGAPAYAEHESTKVLCLAYDLKDGKGKRLWVPAMGEPPQDLLDYIAAGGLIEAHNSSFEYYIWYYVCHLKMGWPLLPIEQLRCSASKAAAMSLPRALEKVGPILGVEDEKIKEGKRLIKKFCTPRTPTKKDSRRRIRPSSDPVDAMNLYNYNIGDIVTESQVSEKLPDMMPQELALWILDQKVNTGGVAIDTVAVKALLGIVDLVFDKYTAELRHITGGAVKSTGEVAKTLNWSASRGFIPVSKSIEENAKRLAEWKAGDAKALGNLDADVVSSALGAAWCPPEVHRVLEIRASLGAASIKKLKAIDRRINTDGRLRDLFMFCGADRTGRWAGRGPQPQNLPNSGPAFKTCPSCGQDQAGEKGPERCRVCGSDLPEKVQEWGAEAVERFLAEVSGVYYIESLERKWPDLLAPIAGSLRGLFIAGEGYDLLCSDYSAIEAVVLAALAGEEWRLEVFRTHGKIYEMSAAKITGVPFEEFVRHKKETGDHHPLRKKIGKVAELASGYGGGLMAWLAFGADKAMAEPGDELGGTTKLRDGTEIFTRLKNRIDSAVKTWRAESPMIALFWKQIEQRVIQATQNPEGRYEYRGIKFGVKEDVLYIRLLSGRMLKYHNPRVTMGQTPWGSSALKFSFMGTDSKTKRWCRISSHGGKLTENIVQATARDILADALLKTAAVGYRTVLHVHDEMVAEVPEGWGTVEELEKIMADSPEWCRDWPIKAAGGWRGKRYRKD